MSEKTASTGATVSVELDRDYREFERLVAFRVAQIKRPIFQTDATGFRGVSEILGVCK